MEIYHFKLKPGFYLCGQNFVSAPRTTGNLIILGRPLNGLWEETASLWWQCKCVNSYGWNRCQWQAMSHLQSQLNYECRFIFAFHFMHCNVFNEDRGFMNSGVLLLSEMHSIMKYGYMIAFVLAGK